MMLSEKEKTGLLFEAIECAALIADIAMGRPEFRTPVEDARARKASARIAEIKECLLAE